MPHEGVELSRFQEPEELVKAMPGVAFRATALRADPFDVSLTTIGLGDVFLQTGRSTPRVAFARAVPGTAVLQLPLENVDTLLLNGRHTPPRAVGLYGGGAELIRSNLRDSSHAVLALPMDRAEPLLCPQSSFPLLRPGAQALLEAGAQAWDQAVGVMRSAAAAAARALWTFDAEQPRVALRDALLQAMRNLIAGAEGTGPSGDHYRPRTWRRIVVGADEYLRVNVARPIYTEELCAAPGISASSLADAYHATFGLSPHRLLKLHLVMVRSLLRSLEGARGAGARPIRRGGEPAGRQGTLGAEAVARAAPDGHTLLYGGLGPIAAAPHLVPNLCFDPLRDLAPVHGIGASPCVIVVGPRRPWTTLAEFVAAARARPESLAYASPGIGTAPHPAAEVFQDVARLRLLHVPYVNTAEILNDVMGGGSSPPPVPPRPPSRCCWRRCENPARLDGAGVFRRDRDGALARYGPRVLPRVPGRGIAPHCLDHRPCQGMSTLNH
jgi:AraC-like DNA-binding protein